MVNVEVNCPGLCPGDLLTPSTMCFPMWLVSRHFDFDIIETDQCPNSVFYRLVPFLAGHGNV